MSQIVQQYIQRYKFSRICIASGLVLMIALLTSCSSYTLGQGGQLQATPTPTSSQQAQNCGKVDTALNGQPSDRNKARLSGNCFWQAFQNCQAATLILVEHSLDTGAVHTFTIKGNNGKCSIIDTVKHYIVPNNLNSTTTYTCSGLVMQADGLHFIACGNAGNIDLPL